MMEPQKESKNLDPAKYDTTRLGQLVEKVTNNKVKIKLERSGIRGVKFDHRSRNRMKIAFKLNAAAAEAYKQFIETTKPPDVSESDFVRDIFFLGAETFWNQAQEAVRKYMEESGSVSGLPNPTLLGDSQPLVSVPVEKNEESL